MFGNRKKSLEAILNAEDFSKEYYFEQMYSKTCRACAIGHALRANNILEEQRDTFGFVNVSSVTGLAENEILIIQNLNDNDKITEMKDYVKGLLNDA